MKTRVLISAALAIVGYFISCSKSPAVAGYSSCTNLPVDSDSSALLAFAKSDSITPFRDTSGLYYQIINQGSGMSPSDTSTIFVTYTGKLMNGDIFDSTSNAAGTGFVLENLIFGWQIGLSKIQTGGHIKLLIPSALAYGCMGSGTVIPPNSPVYFDITLVSFN
jgi:FKBP-type peptidyl-prolyl cis-trans isomerase FkpA